MRDRYQGGRKERQKPRSESEISFDFSPMRFLKMLSKRTLMITSLFMHEFFFVNVRWYATSCKLETFGSQYPCLCSRIFTDIFNLGRA